MVAAERSFASETLRVNGDAYLNDPVNDTPSMPINYRGYHYVSQPASVVDGFMAARCGIAGPETSPDTNEFCYWQYEQPDGRFVTEARCRIKLSTSASTKGSNDIPFYITLTPGDDNYTLSVNRTSTAIPWTFYINGVDTGVEMPQNTDEADVTLYFSGSDVRAVVTIDAVDVLDETTPATGRPSGVWTPTIWTRRHTLSGYYYATVNNISYTLTPYLITTSLPGPINEGDFYTTDIEVDGDTGAFSITGGAFPPGLSMSGATGVIEGYATTPGSYSFDVTFEEFDTGVTTTRTYELTVSSIEPEPTTEPAWKATLNGVTVCGGDCPDDANVAACLIRPPTGTGVPPLRTQDQSYPQRDGVDMFDDYYDPRILTFEVLVGDNTTCGCAGSARQNAYDLTDAWKRTCNDVELVLGTDACETPMARETLYVNQAYNPSAELSEGDELGSRHWYIEQSGTMTTTSTDPFIGDQNAVVLHLFDGTINSGIAYGRYTPSLDLIACGPGTQVDVSVRIRASIEESHNLTIVYVDAGGSAFAATLVDSAVVNDTTWTELTGGDTAPAGTVGIILTVVTPDAPVVGQTIEADGLMVCFDTGLPPGGYFDGSTTDDFDPIDGGIIYEWLGDENNSPSRMVQLTPTTDRDTTGPFGVIGRPRVADVVWRRGKHQVGDGILRFDAVDHRLYVLDQDGTPGSGAVCETVASPSGLVYDGAVAATLPYHHWPLDFPRVGIQESSGVQIGAAEDIIGSFDVAPVFSLNGTGSTGLPQQVAPISFGLSMSAVQGPASHQGRPWTSGYDSGMVGWWQETPVGATTGGAAIYLDNSSDYRVGHSATGGPSPVVKFGGFEVAMNADTQAAFGFTDTYHGQPVLIMLVFVSGTLYIFAAHDGTSSPFLVQTVSGSGLPADLAAPTLTAFTAKISNVMSGMDNYTATPEADGEAIMAQLAPYGFDTPLSQVTMPDKGQLCGPITATFEAGVTFGEVYIFKEDGTYVGIAYNPFGQDYAPTFLETDTGTATRFFGTIDASNDITGNPFLEIRPGEVLNVFGGGDVTVCFRPSVISA